MSLSFAIGEHGWELAGWTMLHFLWIGSLAALAGAAIRAACRRQAPAVRYAVSLGTLAALAILPLAIAIYLTTEIPLPRREGLGERFFSAQTATQTPSQNTTDIDQKDVDLAPAGPAQQAAGARLNDPYVQSLQKLLQRAVDWLPWLWLMGTPLTFAVLATGLVGGERLRRHSRPIDSGMVAETCARLCATLRIGRQVGLAVCERIAQPVLVGIVRPIVLLPPAALAGWSPEQLEMVLLHELAHVRRWDNLVNLGQRVVESLLFFHPAVWLASRQVRRDREQCCDAVVVAHTAKPQAYAKLLVAIAAARGNVPLPIAASALADHPLGGRIRRILQLEEEPMLVSRSTVGLVALVLLTTVTLAACKPSDRGEAPSTPTVSAGEKANLRYDGKTFDYWRNLWQTELKTEQRTETIKALAAFGRAGYGKEAAEAILDVAGQYDFSYFGDSPEGKLKQAVFKSLASSTTSHLSAVYWLPILQQRLSEDPVKWKSLTIPLLSNLTTGNKSVKKRLQDIARHADPYIRRLALLALVRADPQLEDPEILKLVKTALTGNNTDTALALLRQLQFRHLDRLPEQLALLFHKDQQVQRWARGILTTMNFANFNTMNLESQLQISNRLLQVLDDPQRVDDHVAAIRALAAMGSNIQDNKQQVVKRLQQVLAEGDHALLTPTLVALARIQWASGEDVVEQLPFELSEQRKAELSDAIEQMPAEKALMFPARNPGDGGGFF